MQPFFVAVVAVVVAFFLGVGLSQKVKDWLAGVPSVLRADLNGIVADVVTASKQTQAQVVSSAKAAVKDAAQKHMRPSGIPVEGGAGGLTRVLNPPTQPPTPLQVQPQTVANQPVTEVPLVVNAG